MKHRAQVAQERFCRQILGELGALPEGEGRSCHTRYLDAQDLLKRRHEDLAWAFGPPPFPGP